MTAVASSRTRSWVWVAVVTASSLIILGVLQPHFLLSATTPSGGDMGAHVYGPAFLRDVLIPEGRLIGWSNDWFAGFPAYYFYFPLPSLVIVILDVFIPYGTAFKLVTVMGLVAMPPAVAFMTRSFGFSRVVAAVTAAGATVFVFLESYSIYGGNVASTLAGEFTYSWSFASGFVYLGYLMRALDGERKAVPRAVIAFAFTALCHVLTTLVLAIVGLSLLLRRNADRRSGFLIWGWSFALTSFWAVPLLLRFSNSSDMVWTPLRRWEELFPIELWLLLPVAIIGAIWAVRRTHRVAPLVVASLLPIIYYPIPTLLPDLAPGLFGDVHFKLWNGRLLPYWYFGIVYFASVGVAAAGLFATRRLPDRLSLFWARAAIALGGVVGIIVVTTSELPRVAAVAIAVTGLAALAATFLTDGDLSTRGLMTMVSGAVLALGALAGVSFIDGWARWNYEGYENKAVYPEYESLMKTIDTLPPGRVQWEQNSSMNEYGTPMALMLIPYWTERHQSMEGLFFESSLTTPFHFITAGEVSLAPSNAIPGLPYDNFNFDRGVAHLGHFGVDYYVSYTPEAKEKADAHPDMEPLLVSDPFAVYGLPDRGVVEVATHMPAVYDPDLTPDGVTSPTFHQVMLDWFADIDLLDRWVLSDGPAEWERIGPDVSRELAGATPVTSTGTVSDVVVDDHRISFTTDAVGVPHLIKVTYFPNWEAEGAEGPWHGAPSVMVVVPTQNEVVLEFRNQTPERVGWLLTVGAVGGFVYWRRESTRRQDSPDAEETSESSRDTPEQP
ncbi:MAG TPA: hypothetical protein VMS74_11185 [Acidimicrobiia bacterium]|nr:hypothetical protein [Acidimicrobiia bacterium]